MNKMTPEELEQFIHRELQALPRRSAPRTLETRVLAALERQALIPWYHRSWSHWPAAVRAVFLAMGLAGVAAVLAGYLRVSRDVEQSVLLARESTAWADLGKLHQAALWTADLANQMIAAIPGPWLWGGAACFLFLNAAFFGLSAVGYRVLYRKP